jgi:putative membrane protein
MVTTLPALLATLLYAVVGIVVFAVGFLVLDLLTPGKLWQEIHEKQNVAVAVFAGAVAIGLAMIVAAAIHG